MEVITYNNTQNPEMELIMEFKAKGIYECIGIVSKKKIQKWSL